MQLITCDDWTEQSIGHGEHEKEYHFARTSDPRVLAVIQRDNEGVTVSQQYDGDAINPILYNDYRTGPDWVAGYDDGSASTIKYAYDRFNNETADRYLWIFHGIVVVQASGGYDRDGDWMVVSSNAYNEHIGNPHYATREEAVEDCLAIQKDLEMALDGYLYGIGYATNEAHRLHDDEEIDLDDGNWEIEISSWGFVGEDYAKREAGGFQYERPSLPEMLEVTA